MIITKEKYYFKENYYPKVSALRQQIVNLLSDPVHFQTWILTSFISDEEVGVVASCSDCPVARFLKSEGIAVDVFNEFRGIPRPRLQGGDG